MANLSAPLLTIGMPVFNGELYMERALESLLAQDYDRWVLCIADNQSTDSTPEIAAHFVSRDSRISYSRHQTNLGAPNNFIFLANLANTPYFMWAASDDEWSHNYLSSCIKVLESQPDVGFVGGAICNTDLSGTCIRFYEPFSEFDSPSVKERVGRFLAAIEANGKANMIYSVFRTELVRDLCHITNIFDGWGADMAFIAASLSRRRYRQVTQATLYKRVVSESDIATAKLLNANRHSEIQFGGNFPTSFFTSYTKALMNAMPTLGLRFLVLKVMLARGLRLLQKLVIGIGR